MKSPSTINQSVKCGLHFVGMWPGTPFPGLHKLYWVTSMAFFQTYQYRYIIQHFRSDSFIETVDNLCISVAFSQTCMKLIIAWINHNVLNDILSTMEEDCKKSAVIDTNNLILKSLHISNPLTTTVMLLYPLSVVFHVSGTAASRTVNDSYPLFLKMDLPFEIEKSPNYELVITAQFLQQTSGAFAFGVVSAVFVMVVLHAGYQIDIMCQTILDVPLRGREQLKFFIKRHQDVIVFTEAVESFFTYIALSQLLLSIITTCCLGFIIVTSIGADGGVPLLIKSLLFYFAIWTEAFLYCYAGEYLRTKSNMICETAYKCLWYNLQPNESQLLIITILRSQKGFAFTFGKFSSMSLENFTSIMKTSASYVSVLLAMS